MKIVEGSGILEGLGVAPGPYVLSTIHRQGNMDDGGSPGEIFRGLGLAARELEMPIILPLRPRTGKMLVEFGIEAPAGLRA